jgi:hypothetical protein
VLRVNTEIDKSLIGKCEGQLEEDFLPTNPMLGTT